MATTIRQEIPFSLNTLAPNAVVTPTAWMGIQNAITSLHQRGKNVLTAQGQMNRDIYTPILGLSTGHGGTVIGPKKYATLPFQIPSGYDRFNLILGYFNPAIFSGSTGQNTLRIAKLGIYMGLHEIDTYSSGFGLPNVIIHDGILPIQTNQGYATSAYILLSFEITAVDGSEIGAGQIVQVSPYSHGFDFLSLALYKSDEC